MVVYLDEMVYLNLKLKVGGEGNKSGVWIRDKINRMIRLSRKKPD